jgi:hypothetical protein
MTDRDVDPLLAELNEVKRPLERATLRLETARARRIAGAARPNGPDG